MLTTCDSRLPSCTLPHPPFICCFANSNSVLSTLHPPPATHHAPPCCMSVSVVPPAYLAQLAADMSHILAQCRGLLGESRAAAAAATGSTSSSAEGGAAAAAAAAAVSGLT